MASRGMERPSAHPAGAPGRIRCVHRMQGQCECQCSCTHRFRHGLDAPHDLLFGGLSFLGTHHEGSSSSRGRMTDAHPRHRRGHHRRDVSSLSLRTVGPTSIPGLLSTIARRGIERRSTHDGDWEEGVSSLLRLDLSHSEGRGGAWTVEERNVLDPVRPRRSS